MGLSSKSLSGTAKIYILEILYSENLFSILNKIFFTPENKLQC